MTAEPGGAASAPEQQKSEVVDSMTGTLDQWKARIDELKVQVDLAKLDARERATKQLDIAAERMPRRLFEAPRGRT